MQKANAYIFYVPSCICGISRRSKYITQRDLAVVKTGSAAKVDLSTILEKFLVHKIFDSAFHNFAMQQINTLRELLVTPF